MSAATETIRSERKESARGTINPVDEARVERDRLLDTDYQKATHYSVSRTARSHQKLPTHPETALE